MNGRARSAGFTLIELLVVIAIIAVLMGILMPVTQLYYNGLWVGSANSADSNFGQIAVGVNRGMTNFFGCTIDEVRVYNRALSYAEAAGLAGVKDEIPVSF